MSQSAVISGLSHCGAGVLVLMAGALLWQNLPLAWQPGRTIAQRQEEFCPHRSAPYSVPSALYQTFVAQEDWFGSSSESVHRVLGVPACTLPPIAIRADAVTEREVYYREDGVAIVLGYEEGRLVGYSEAGTDLPETIDVVQSWSIAEGDRVAGYPVVAGLGELSLAIQGFVYAPETGLVNRHARWSLATDQPQPLSQGCILYHSPAFPAYLSRLCGVEQPGIGAVLAQHALGRVHDFLHFALLTVRPTADQPTGAQRWHYVAPAPEFVAQFL
ncbi:MAG: hypothetical protein ACO3EZ_16585 [Prochlorotrichaceae cyanobacterium]